MTNDDLRLPYYAVVTSCVFDLSKMISALSSGRQGLDFSSWIDARYGVEV